MSECMQCAVERFVASKENGLCLIDMPTGSGKTYLTKEIIKRYVCGEILQEVKTIIYLTPQKKNIDDIYNSLKKDLSENPSVFDANVLRIYANYENVLAKFLDVYNRIPSSIKKKQSCKELKKSIEDYTAWNKEDLPKEFLNKCLAEIREHYEIAFRKDISEELSKIAKKKCDKKRKLNTKEYSWIKELYPACLTEDRKVLFMTVDKFVAGNDPIISKPYRFISNSKIKNALVFIDEFDATKDVLLNQEIQNCADYKIDLIKLFSSISNTLKGKEFPLSVFADSLDENDSESSIYSFNKMKKRFAEVEKEYFLNYSFKFDTPEDKERYFLFDDYQIHTVLNSNTDGKIVLEVNKKKKQNIVSISDNSDDGRFYRTIYSIKNAINSFIYCCSKMANIYMKHYNDEARRSNKDMMEIDQAVSTIIDLYNLDHTMAKNITAMIVDNSSIYANSRVRDIFDTDFYMNGFRYYDFKDDISHNESTTMAMCYFNNTPEKFMLSLAGKARVVGLSATASIETVTGNYNLEYLKDRLGDDYYELPIDNKRDIQHYIDSRLNRDGYIQVIEEKIDENDSVNLEKIVAQLFDSSDNIELFAGKLEKYMKPKATDPYYDIKRIVKAMKSVRYFISNKEAKVLLVMTNRSVVENSENNIFSKAIIDKMIESLCEEAEVSVPKAHYLNSADFNDQKDDYKKDVQAGQKVVLFSSYNTVGTGQNLQYEIDDKENDIDSIYLELPTNILVNLSELREEPDLIKSIYQHEALKTSGEIMKNIAFSNIKSAFKRLITNGQDEFYDRRVYETNSVNNHIVKILIQAVGRICRTKGEKKKTYIHVDEGIYNKVDFSVAFKDDRRLNPEFEKIAEKNRKHEKSDMYINLNKACERNARVKTRIENMLNVNRTSWSDSDVEQWNDMRDFVLKHPTISKSDLDLEVKNHYSIKDFYLETNNGKKINRYSFDTVCEKINYDYDSERIKDAIKINESGTRLTDLVRHPAVRKAFDDNGYATSFERDDCIILPVVYQNIYKGALGEVAGKAILESYGIRLSEITDNTKFEKFDFCLADNTNVYIDFKNWSENDKVNREEYRQKCLEKLDRIGGSKVFIINVVANDFKKHISHNGRIIEISCLCKSQNRPELDNKERTEVIELLLEASNDGNM